MPQPYSEQDKFLEELQDDSNLVPDVFDQPLNPESQGETGESSPTGETGADADQNEEDEEKPAIKAKTRRERRLLQKLADERKSAMFLAERLESYSGAEKAIKDEDIDYLKGIERIYGTDSPEAQLATDLLKKALVGVREDAENRAYERFLQDKQKEAAEYEEANRELDSFIDDIEESYDIEMTDTQEKGFFQLLQKMSPKDRDGNITNFADPHAVWEIYQEKAKSSSKGNSNRAKSLSSRSMINSGSQKDSKIELDATQRFLKENGIL